MPQSDQPQSGVPEKALEMCRRRFQQELAAAKARKLARQETAGTPPSGDESRSGQVIGIRKAHRRSGPVVGAIAVMVCALLIIGGMPIRHRRSSIALAQSPTLIVWHDGNDWEHRQLVELGRVFGAIEEVEVVIERKSDIWGELIRAVILQKPPDLAVVSEETAHRLLAAQALTPFNTAHIAPDGTIHTQAYFGYLAEPTPWARSLVLVAPRTTRSSEETCRLAAFLLQSI